MSVHLGSFWDVVAAPFNWVAGAAGTVVDIVHILPGVDWLGDQLKDFSRTDVGSWTINILGTAATSGLYSATSATLSAYTALAPQLASLVFAFPQMANGHKSFWEAYVRELTLRVKETANTIAPEAGAALAAAIEPTVTVILNNPSIQQAIAVGTDDLQGVTQKAIDAGVSEASDYASQKALDIINTSNDAVNMYFDGAGHQTLPDGVTRVRGRAADAADAAFNAAVARHARGAMSANYFNQAAALAARERGQMSVANNPFLDEVNAAAAQPIVVTRHAPASSTKKLVIGGGASLLLAYLIVEFL